MELDWQSSSNLRVITAVAPPGRTAGAAAGDGAAAGRLAAPAAAGSSEWEDRAAPVGGRGDAGGKRARSEKVRVEIFCKVREENENDFVRIF